jgi:hypothetical protein
MQHGHAVRIDGGLHGADIRVWVDDEAGHHQAVCEVHLSVVQVMELAADIRDAQERAMQLQLDLGL